LQLLRQIPAARSPPQHTDLLTITKPQRGTTAAFIKLKWLTIAALIDGDHLAAHLKPLLAVASCCGIFIFITVERSSFLIMKNKILLSYKATSLSPIGKN
jgi:hypothetical protein